MGSGYRAAARGCLLTQGTQSPHCSRKVCRSPCLHFWGSQTKSLHKNKAYSSLGASWSQAKPQKYSMQAECAIVEDLQFISNPVSSINSDNTVALRFSFSTKFCPSCTRQFIGWLKRKKELWECFYNGKGVIDYGFFPFIPHYSHLFPLSAISNEILFSLLGHSLWTRMAQIMVVTRQYFNCTDLSLQLTIMTKFHARLEHDKYLLRVCCLLMMINTS